jgi:hypothetical protein
MKSAYELAMERLAKSSPTRTPTDAQKAELAEIDSIYRARLAQAELSFRDELAAAQAKGDPQAEETIRQHFASEKSRIEEERESRKERVRRDG